MKYYETLLNLQNFEPDCIRTDSETETFQTELSFRVLITLTDGSDGTAAEWMDGSSAALCGVAFTGFTSRTAIC